MAKNKNVVQGMEEKEKKSIGANLKIEKHESNTNSDIPGTSNNATDVDKSAEEKIHKKTPNNEQQTTDICDTQNTVEDNKDERIKQEESTSRRSTSSQLNDKVCFLYSFLR